MMLLNHNVAGNQPISEIISNPDLAFQIGIGLGFLCGIIFGICIYSMYRDIKEDKSKIKGIKDV